jgi:hypothetical protein
MAGPWEEYQEQPTPKPAPEVIEAKPWEDFQYTPTQPVKGFEADDVIWDQQRSQVFTAPRGTAEFFATVSQDDTFDDQPDSTVLEELVAGTEAQAAYLGLTALAVGAAQPENMAGFISSRKKALASAQQRQAEYMKKFYNDFSQADGAFSAAGVMVDNLPAMGRVVLTQYANSFIPLIASGAGTLAGSAAGPVGMIGGGAAGAFVGGAAVEVGAELDSLLLEKGYDTSKAADLIRLSQDQETMDSLREKALAKGLTTAGVDAVFTVVTGGVFKALKPVTKVGKVGKAAAGFATETIGEGLGEGAGQLVAYGEMSSKDVLLEMVSSMGQSVGQTAITATATASSPAVQKVQSAIFKGEKISQSFGDDIDISPDTFTEMDSVEAELDAAYNAAMYERGDEPIKYQPMSIEPIEVVSPTIQEKPAIKKAIEAEKDTPPAIPKQSSAVSRIAKDFGIGVEKYVAPLSTRIKNLSPKLFARTRRFEFDVKRQIMADNAAILPFLNKEKNLPADARKSLDIAMKNGDTETINKIADSYDMKAEIDAIRPTYDNVFKRAQENKVDVEYRENFYPRLIKDFKGLMDHLQRNEAGTFNTIKKAIKAKEDATGRVLRDDERIKVIDNLMLGRRVEGISLAQRGELKARSIEEINAEIDQFYASTAEAMLHYNHVINEAVEINRLFGRKDANAAFMNDPERSVGALVDEMMEAEGLSVSDAEQLKDMLNARFNSGRMGKGMSVFRDLTYIDVMGSPLNAITQFGDLAPAIYNAGVMRVIQTVPGASVDRTKVNLRDIGIEDIAQEFDSRGWSSDLVDKVFKATGLQKIDRLGKLTLVNSTLKKQETLAKKSDPELIKTLELYFGDNAEQVRQDLAAGIVTEDVKFLAFSTLMDYQPVARMEMPEAYLRAGNGKIFYMLKSFTLKQFDVYRREGASKIIKGIKDGDPKMVTEGTTRFAYLYALWVMGGASADALKDLTRSMVSLVSGEGEDKMEEPEDYVFENVMKAFGVNKYSIDQLNRPWMPDTPADFAFEYVAPPTKLVDNAWRDYQKVKDKDNIQLEDLQSIRSIPVFGELWWFWLGGGATKPKTKNEESPKKGNY